MRCGSYLYLNPPPGAVLLSIDEKTAIAARSRKVVGEIIARNDADTFIGFLAHLCHMV